MRGQPRHQLRPQHDDGQNDELKNDEGNHALINMDELHFLGCNAPEIKDGESYRGCEERCLQSHSYKQQEPNQRRIVYYSVPIDFNPDLGNNWGKERKNN